MTELSLDLLRRYELRLLRCTLPPPPLSDNIPAPSQPLSHQANPLHTLIEDILNSIESGNYIQALSSDASRTVFQHINSSELFKDSVDCADRFYSELQNRVASFLVGNEPLRMVLITSIAVAAFLAFTQCNLTGPIDGDLHSLNMLLTQCKECGVEWEAWARLQLMAAGSDLLGKFSNLQYIAFAKMLLMGTKDFLSEGSVSSLYRMRSISWWLARVILFQQRMLDDRSSSLFDLLQVLKGETLHHFGTLEKAKSYWGANLLEEEALAVVSMVHLEVGILEHTYRRVDSSRLHFETAEVASGLELSVTGVLGCRTLHQVEPKAQLVLVTNTSASDGDNNALSNREDNSGERHNETHEASDILMAPRILENDKTSGIRALGAIPLKPIQQAVILAQCLLIEKSARHDEMQRWKMAPYIEAVDSQQSSHFMIQCFCDILRIRWESTRTRTKERALLMMNKLVQGLYEPSPGVAERIYFCYGVYSPTIPALRKEYGELLVSCGLIGEAVKIFEDLELWDNLIYCYSILEKKAAAVELIKTRLIAMPNDPRLWCSLGDTTNNDSCYERALEVSNNRSARAKRSLARNAYNRGEYENSKVLWESAMALNSLYPDGWFALGAAALKAREVEKALDGFTRAVQLDPENGEAWNNIACLHMIKKRNKESFIAFKEALKFKRNSWQLWENYSHVAADVGNFGQALEAIQMVLNLTNNKRIDAPLLEKMMLEIEGRASTKHFLVPTANDNHNSIDETLSTDSGINEVKKAINSDFGLVRCRETEHLVDFLGKILQQVVRTGGNADIWGLYARWHKIKGDLTMCSEALLKQVRSYQGSDLWKDRDRFKKFADASLELCKVYMEISASSVSRRELLAAEMHLKNTIKQGGSFSDAEEFIALQACLDEVKIKLNATSVS